MTSPYSARQKEIFFQALELCPENQSQFVRQQCGGDQALFEAVIEMIRTNAAVSDFFEQGAGIYFEEKPEPARDSFRGNSRFQCIRMLGSGGFGSVFEVLDREHGTTVALKVPNHPEADELLGFKREFRSLAKCSHPNIVTLYELFDDARHWFFTMELVRGTDFVSYARNSASRLRPALGQIADALYYLHQKCEILHRDIKPSNILVTGDGKVKLLDFGLARSVSRHSAMKTQTVAGTAAYMAPELWTDTTLREASDWYSVGAVLYEALTGQPPFQGGFLEVLTQKNREPVRPPREFVADIPDDLNDLCLDLLQLNPESRRSGVVVMQRMAAAQGAIQMVAPSGAVHPTVRLVGRETHLASLREAFQEAGNRQTVCVHVQGRSGMGKTALCKEFLSDIEKQGALVLSGRCYENETVPYKALDPVVDSLADYLKRLSSNETAAVLPREGPLQALSRVFPTLLAVKAIEQARSDSGIETSPRDLQRRAMAALKETLARIAERRPCVVHIDDFQWGDLDSVECLASILGPPDPPASLFIFSYRSEDLSSTHLQRLVALHHDRELYCGKVRELVVDRLSSSECLELVRGLLGPEGDAAYQQIDDETEGMPLFIHELALHARSGFRSTTAVPEGLSLQAMIGKRIGLLPDPARRMLEVVSLAAKPIDFDVACRVAGIGNGELPSRHTLVQAERLIRFKSTGSGGVIEPYHDKIREAVVAGLTADTKQKHFQALAAALEAQESADPEIVYQYFLKAGDLAKAEAYIEIAAERAECAMAFDLAVTLREKHSEIRNVSEPERSILLERLAQALALAGRGLESAEMYQSAAHGAAPDRYHRLLRKAGEQYIRSGHFEQGRALLTALLERVGFHMPAHRWQALLMLLARRCQLRIRGLRFDTKPGRETNATESEKLEICRVTSLALALQDPIQSAELQARHLLHSLRLGEPYRIANSLAMEAGYLVARGGAGAYPAASKLLDKVEELAARSNHPNGQTLALSVRSKVAWLAGRWKESANLGEEVNRLATEQYTRVAWEAYPSSIFWMCSLACMGRWRELIARLPGLQADSEARGDLLEKTSLPVFTFAYVRWLLANEPETAAERLERARVRLNEPGFIPHRFGICYGRADVALYMQNPEQARQTVIQGWAELENAMVLRLQPVRIFMLHLRGRVACAAAAASTDQQSRRQLLDEAMADARRIRNERTGWGNGISDLIEASIAAEQHRLDDARALLEAAEQACLLAGMEHFVAVARYRKALLLQGDARRDAERQAAVWFTGQDVAQPERIVEMLCPGSWDIHA